MKNNIVNKEVSDWKQRVFDAVLTMMANPSFECNKDGSYQIEPLLDVVAQERQRVAKAYGGCEECYGKGYATVRYGLDFGYKEEEPTTHIEYCSCERGKQLESLIEQKSHKIRKGIY